MKTVYKKISIGSRNFVLTISLLVSLIAMASGEAASGNVNVESLDGLQVSLVSPNVSGAERLTTDDNKAHYYEGNDNDLVCHLNNLSAGTHRLTVKVTLGTNTYVLAVVDIVVAANADNETAEDSMNLTAVKSFGDGSGVPVPACYGVDEDDNAHITTPLSVGDGVASADGAVASGRADGEGAQIVASADGAVASGAVSGDSSQINASNDGAVASGAVSGEGAQIVATEAGAVARGYVEGDEAQINAGAEGSVANGYVRGEGARIYAGAVGAIARGYVEGADAQIYASANGSVANGFAVDGSVITEGIGAEAGGYANEGVIKASGMGTIAKGHAYDGGSVIAEGIGAVASGMANGTSGDTKATGDGSQAFGVGVQALAGGQAVFGQCNVPDEEDYQFIVGNGADDQNRHNAFAVTKAGDLALFKADGTPVTLSVAQLEALIALLPNP